MKTTNKKAAKNADYKQVLTDYLQEHKLRSSKDRELILDEIYASEGHFEIDSLYMQLLQKNANVSRGTIYNNLDIFIACGLIVKHQFGNKKTFYEKSWNYKQHEHLICTNCEKIFEFTDPNVKPISTMAAGILGFTVKTQSLVIHGECESFCKTGKCAHGNAPKNK